MRLREQDYQIINGVRRAKAAHLMEKQTISARVQNPDGTLQPMIQVTLDSLRSPYKDAIDLITQTDVDRWHDVQTGTQRGDPLPPIIIQPEETGVTLNGLEFNTE